MFTLLLIIHLLVAIALVVSILLQRGEAGGLSGAFGGGGGSQTLFGGRGAASFLSKATAYLGGAFLVISFALALVQAHRTGTTSEGRNIIQESMPPAPATPAGTGARPGAATPGQPQSQPPSQPAEEGGSGAPAPGGPEAGGQ